MENLRVSYLQTDIVWENKVKNLENFSTHIAELHHKTDLIVLPEMFPTGFTMAAPSFAEKTTGNVLQWMKEQAWRADAVVAGSLIVEEDDDFYNRFYFVFPDGKADYYDKRHLFRMGSEHKQYTAGNERVLLQIKGWSIRPLVCYDLRFPVWARNQNDYDLLIYTANWPAKRRLHWETLLRARSIENQAYTLGVNRIGTDGNGVEYSGNSQLFSPFGELLSSDSHQRGKCETILLDKQKLSDLRSGFPVHLDADKFIITND